MIMIMISNAIVVVINITVMFVSVCEMIGLTDMIDGGSDFYMSPQPTGLPLQDLGLNRTRKQIYYLIWRRLGYMSRIGNAAAAAALAGGVDGYVESRDLDSIPLIADLLGVALGMFHLHCLIYANHDTFFCGFLLFTSCCGICPLT